MQKILFSDIFGLTDAVLQHRKTETRRKARINAGEYHVLTSGSGPLYDMVRGRILDRSTYKKGEIVALAQRYEDALKSAPTGFYGPKQCSDLSRLPGYRNKLFVTSELLPHRIRIDEVGLQLLTSISDDSCMAEGVQMAFSQDLAKTYYVPSTSPVPDHSFTSPQKAFWALYWALAHRKRTLHVLEDVPKEFVYVYKFTLLK